MHIVLFAMGGGPDFGDGIDNVGSDRIIQMLAVRVVLLQKTRDCT